MDVTVAWYMSLAAVLFAIGAIGLLLRRNALVMFMSIELMLNSVNLTFVAAGRELGVKAARSQRQCSARYERLGYDPSVLVPKERH